jgi:hypothetical protein
MGCGRKTTTVVAPDGTKATVTKKGDASEITVTGSKGEKVHIASGGSGVALPSDFPKDAPVFPKAKITASTAAKDTTSLILSTTEPVRTVLDFYTTRLKDNGWEIEATTQTQDGAMITGKKEKRTFSAYISRTGEETTITLGIMSNRE